MQYSNFDMELRHSRMRASLQATSGMPSGFSNAAMWDLGSHIAAQHEYLNEAPKPTRVRGRPPSNRRRRKRFCPWNAFVEQNKPAEGSRRGDRERISSGNHLRELANVWKELSAAEREPYVRVARARKAMLGGDDQSDSPAEDNSDACGFSGAWGIGGDGFPLSFENSCRPEFDAGMLNRVQEWVEELDKIIPHMDGSLPGRGWTEPVLGYEI